MSEQLTPEQYKANVEAQAELLCRTLEQINSGDLGANIDVAEGEPVMERLAEGIVQLVDRLRNEVTEQQRIRRQLETPSRPEITTVRHTGSLPPQQYSVRDGWREYAGDGAEVSFPDDGLAASHWIQTALEAIEHRQPVAYRNGGQEEATLAVPVSYADELIGLLGFSADELAGWGESDLAAVEAIAEQVGLALENQRLFDQTQDALAETERQAQRLATLNEIGAALSGARFLEDVVAIVRRQTNDLLGGEWATLALVDAHSGEVEVHDLEGVALSERQLSDLEDSVVEEVLKARRLLVDEDLSGSTRERDRQLLEAGVRSRMVAPLLGQTGALGALSVGCRHPHAFSANDQNLLLQLSSLVAATIENLRLTEATRTRASQLERLTEVESALSQVRSEDEVVEALTLVSAQAQRVTLYYLEADADDVPQRQVMRSHWDSGRLVERVPPEMRVIDMKMTPAANLWIDDPDTPVLVEDIRTDPRGDVKTRQTSEAFDIRSMAVLPLRAGDRWQGVVFFTWSVPHVFSDTERFVLGRLPETLAAIVARLRATTAQKQALAETAALYELSARLNSADTIDEVVQVVAGIRASESAMLLEGEPADSPIPTMMRVAGTWSRTGKGLLPVERPLPMDQFDLSWLWRENPRPHFTTDLENAPSLPENIRATLLATGARAVVWLPLRIRQRWLGTLIVTWQRQHTFTDRDRRIYGSMMSQAAVVINQLRLLRETRLRAEQLELVATIETRLSQAQTEEDVLLALAETLKYPHVLTLSTVEIDGEGFPTNTIPQVRWQSGEFTPEHPAVGMAIPLQALPQWQTWQDDPSAIVYVEDVANAEGLTPQERAISQQFGIGAIAGLPLLSAGRWQGILTFTAPQAYFFDETERFLFERLLEPVAATVASRRAFLAQQEAQQETTALYDAGRRINAATDLVDLLPALVEALDAPALHQAILYTVEGDPADSELRVEVTASWSRDEAGSGLPPGPVTDSQRATALAHLAQGEPHFVRDAVALKGLAPETVHFVAEHGMRALVVLPLRTANRLVGTLLLHGRQPLLVEERLQRIAGSLAPQVAVAVENRTLLLQTQLRARRERVLREITAKVRNVTNVDTILRTAAREVGEALGRETYVYLQAPSGEDALDNVEEAPEA